MFNPKKILVATDFTKESDHALREAITIAEKYGSKIYLLHVIDDIQQCAADYCLGEPEILAEKNRMKDEALRKMDDEISRVMGRGRVEMIHEVRFGDTIDEILKKEHEENIDLVVTAPHGSTKGWHKFSPHLTNDLVNKTACETMVVK
jgi:nucleotide-binding universal stress UspA family protein